MESGVDVGLGLVDGGMVGRNGVSRVGVDGDGVVSVMGGCHGV